MGRASIFIKDKQSALDLREILFIFETIQTTHLYYPFELLQPRRLLREKQTLLTDTSQLETLFLRSTIEKAKLGIGQA
jgi:hypothetical protein